MPVEIDPIQSPQPPVLERITRDIVDTLKGVKKLAGSYIDLIVERPSPVVGQRIRNGLCVVVQQSPAKVTENVSLQYSQWKQPYELYLFAIYSSSSPDPVDGILNRLLADATRALVRDRTRGGLALWTEPKDPIFDIEEITANGGSVIAPFEVEYRTMRDDPFTSAHQST